MPVTARAALAALLLMTAPAAGAPPSFDDLRLTALVRPLIGDAMSGPELVRRSETVLQKYREGVGVGGIYDATISRELMAAALGLEVAIERGVAPEDIAAARIESYFLLYVLTTRSYAPVALAAVGLPLADSMPSDEQPLVEALTDTLAALRGWVAARLPALATAHLAAHPQDARALRALAHYHRLTLDLDQAEARYRELIAADPAAEHHYWLAMVQAARQPEAQARQTVQAVVKAHTRDRWRAESTLTLAKASRELLAARAALAAEPSVDNHLRAITASLLFGEPGDQTSWDTIEAAVRAHPGVADFQAARIAWLMQTNAMAAVDTLTAQLDTTAAPLKTDVAVGWRLAGRFLRVYTAVTQGRIEEVGPLLESIETDRRRLKHTDPFSLDMLAAFTRLLQQILEDDLARTAFSGQMVPAAQERLTALADQALKGLEKAHPGRLDVWRLRLVLNVLTQPDETLKSLERFLARMQKTVGADEQNEARLLAALAYIVAGRRPEGHARLEEALRLAEDLVDGFVQHQQALTTDADMALPACQPGGCFSAGSAWSYLGAVRNMLQGRLPEDQQTAWARATVRVCRKGERLLATLQADHVRQHAELMSHRCRALATAGDAEQVHQCVPDLMNKHGRQPAARLVYASAIAENPANIQEAFGMFAAIGRDEDAAAGLRYDAWKWVAYLAMSNDVMDTAQQAARFALEQRERVTLLGQSLQYAHVVSGGELNLGIGVNPHGEIQQTLTLGLELWSIFPPPIDDTKLDGFVAGDE